MLVVESNALLGASYFCLLNSGMLSGFSGANFANSSERLTTFINEASSNSLIVATPVFLPKVDCTDKVKSLCSPAVETVLRAVRILPPTSPPKLHSHSSAFENESTFSNNAFACCSVNIVMTLCFLLYFIFIVKYQ